MRKEDMGTIGQKLMEIDSSYPCPDKERSPITAAIPPLSITVGWRVPYWHQRRAHEASAGASPY